MNIPIWIEALIGLGAFAGGLGYFVGQFKQGKSQAKLDEGNDKLNTNSLLKEQIDALENKVDRQSNEIQDLTAKVKLLTAALDEERKKFAETILTLQGKDGGWVKFTEDVYKYMEDMKEFTTYTKLLMVRQDKYLNKESF